MVTTKIKATTNIVANTKAANIAIISIPDIGADYIVVVVNLEINSYYPMQHICSNLCPNSSCTSNTNSKHYLCLSSHSNYSTIHHFLNTTKNLQTHHSKPYFHPKTHQNPFHYSHPPSFRLSPQNLSNSPHQLTFKPPFLQEVSLISYQPSSLSFLFSTSSSPSFFSPKYYPQMTHYHFLGLSLAYPPYRSS